MTKSTTNSQSNYFNLKRILYLRYQDESPDPKNRPTPKLSIQVISQLLHMSFHVLWRFDRMYFKERSEEKELTSQQSFTKNSE